MRGWSASAPRSAWRSDIYMSILTCQSSHDIIPVDADAARAPAAARRGRGPFRSCARAAIRVRDARAGRASSRRRARRHPSRSLRQLDARSVPGRGLGARPPRPESRPERAARGSHADRGTARRAERAHGALPVASGTSAGPSTCIRCGSTTSRTGSSSSTRPGRPISADRVSSRSAVCRSGRS